MSNSKLTEARKWLQGYKRPAEHSTGWMSTSDNLHRMSTTELAEILVSYAADLEKQLALMKMTIDLTAAGELFVQPAEGGEGWVFWVNCNDMFYPAADCEGVEMSQIPEVWKAWKTGGWAAVTRWVQEKRDGLPLRKSREETILSIENLQKQLAAREAQLLQIMNWCLDLRRNYHGVREHNQQLPRCEHPLCNPIFMAGQPTTFLNSLTSAPSFAVLRAYVEGLLPAKHAEIEHFDGWNACIEQARESLNKSLEGK